MAKVHSSPETEAGPLPAAEGPSIYQPVHPDPRQTDRFNKYISTFLLSLLICVFSVTATQLFKLLHKYRPETKVQKRERLRAVAVKKSEGGDVTPGKKPITIKYGINHITTLVEQKKAQLVVIAHDVDPIEVCISSRVNIPFYLLLSLYHISRLWCFFTVV